MEKILFYAAGDEKKEKQMAMLAQKMRIDFVPVPAAGVRQQIGYLAGLDGYAEKKFSPLERLPQITEEILVFSGFSGERLDLALETLRQNGLTVPLKAVVTAHNIGWTLAGLFNELTLERAQMQKLRK